MDTSVRSVPFSPSFIEGVAEWRHQVLPVLSLETCLGMEDLNSEKIQRLMVVRAIKNEAAPMEVYRVILRVVPPIRMMTLPIECAPVSDEWIPNNYFAKFVYEWKDGFLVVAHMKHIFDGSN
jgi:chemotaxis signal transduction protein